MNVAEKLLDIEEHLKLIAKLKKKDELEKGAESYIIRYEYGVTLKPVKQDKSDAKKAR